MTGKRFPHYLRPTRGGKWPRSILCVDCVGSMQTRAGDGMPVSEGLDTWHAALLIKKDNDYEAWKTECGIRANVLWERMYTIANELYPMWVFSYRACRQWNLLNLWEELEDGRIIIAERPDQGRIRRDILSSVQRKDNDAAARAPSAGHLSRMLDDSCGTLITGDPPSICKGRFRESQHWWTWVDTRNYGVERGESIRDGASGMDWLIGFVRSLACALHTYKLGSLRPTAASQALHGFRCSYYSGGIYVGCNVANNDLERAAYYGGRCECARVGTVARTVVSGDFASQYCRLCRDNLLPVRCLSHQRIKGGQNGIPSGRCSNKIATVAVETDEAAYPYRRIANEGNREPFASNAPEQHWPSADTDIIYPIGRFITTLCGPELEDAVAHNRVKRWYEWSDYEMQPALREYASAIINMRTTAERCGDTLCIALAKRLGNSMPGKMGERSSNWTYCPYITTDIQYGEWYSPNNKGELHLFRSTAGLVYRRDRAEFAEESVPAIAAWVCSLGRVALLQAIRLAGWENVYYYDTDSIFVNDFGWSCLVSCAAWRHGVGLLLRKVGESNDAEFLGIKHYRFAGKYVCAGLPRHNVNVSEDKWEFVRDITPTEMIRLGRRPQQKEVTQAVLMSHQYRHGVVGADGEVSPIVLNEW